jgi:hypothetical protein
MQVMWHTGKLASELIPDLQTTITVIWIVWRFILISIFNYFITIYNKLVILYLNLKFKYNIMKSTYILASILSINNNSSFTWTNALKHEDQQGWNM